MTTPPKIQNKAAINKTPVQARSKDSLNAIIEAVGELLLQEDWADISVAQIANRASVSTGLLYSRFKGKQELIIHVVKQIASEQLEAIKAMELDPSFIALSSADRLDMLIDSSIQSRRNAPGIMKALRALPAQLSPDEQSWFQTINEETVERVIALVLGKKAPTIQADAQQYAVLMLTKMFEPLEAGTTGSALLSDESLIAISRRLIHQLFFTANEEI